MGITKTLVIDDEEKLINCYNQERENFIKQQKEQENYLINRIKKEIKNNKKHIW